MTQLGRLLAKQQREKDEAAAAYNPATNDYDLAKDPRCLFGWGPPSCTCRFGHACFRALGHPGRCRDVSAGQNRYDPPCYRRQRPKDWDMKLREEANR